MTTQKAKKAKYNHKKPIHRIETDCDGTANIGQLCRLSKTPELSMPHLLYTFNNLLKPVAIKDLQLLVLYLLTENKEECRPSWIIPRNKDKIKQVVVLHIPGMLPEHFSVQDKSVLPIREKEWNGEETVETNILRKFYYSWPTKCPGTPNSVHSPKAAFLDIEVEKDKTPKPVTNKGFLKYEDLILTDDQFIENEYPLHPSHPAFKELPEGFIATKPITCENSKYERKVFALDCEMVRAEDGLHLARITLIDERGESIIDDLVRPVAVVTDYLTRYSGITEDHLKDVKRTLHDVQKKLQKTISSQDVLIGHSLDSDFSVLKIAHPLVIDTAICFNHPRGGLSKPSLRWLAKEHLFRKIQDSEAGHDSVEDALACLDLVNLKLRNGLEFGIHNSNMEPFSARLQMLNKSSVILDKNQTVKFNCNSERSREMDRKSRNSEELDEFLIECVNSKYDLVFATFNDIAEAAGWQSRKDETRDKNIFINYRDQYTTLSQRLEKIIGSLEAGTAVLLYSGTGDIGAFLELQTKKRKYLEDYKIKNWSEISWTQSDDASLRKACERARTGISFLTMVV